MHLKIEPQLERVHLNSISEGHFCTSGKFLKFRTEQQHKIAKPYLYSSCIFRNVATGSGTSPPSTCILCSLRNAFSVCCLAWSFSSIAASFLSSSSSSSSDVCPLTKEDIKVTSFSSDGVSSSSSSSSELSVWSSSSLAPISSCLLDFLSDLTFSDIEGLSSEKDKHRRLRLSYSIQKSDFTSSHAWSLWNSSI